VIGEIPMRSGDARREILHAIRENLAQGLESSPDHLSTPGSSPPVPLSVPERGDAVKHFTEQLTAVGAACTTVRSEAEAATALNRILTDAGARRVVGSDAPIVQRLLHAVGDGFVLERLEHLSRDELFACDAGVTTAQWGIAETGTLVLESARERSRLISLVPPIHVALLSTRCICDSLGDALARVSITSHAITFITGPSRTSDIELTLVVGVHGPQTVHVLLMEEA
jgi:L-lactate dehydrogenase complex protein LldG